MLETDTAALYESISPTRLSAFHREETEAQEVDKLPDIPKLVSGATAGRGVQAVLLLSLCPGLTLAASRPLSLYRFL